MCGPEPLAARARYASLEDEEELLDEEPPVEPLLDPESLLDELLVLLESPPLEEPASELPDESELPLVSLAAGDFLPA